MKDKRWIIVCMAEGKCRQVLNLMDDNFGGEEQGQAFANQFAEVLNNGTDLEDVKTLRKSLLKGNTESLNGQMWKIEESKS